MAEHATCSEQEMSVVRQGQNRIGSHVKPGARNVQREAAMSRRDRRCDSLLVREQAVFLSISKLLHFMFFSTIAVDPHATFPVF